MSHHSHTHKRATSRHVIQAFTAKARARRSLSERIADWITSKSGTMTFLVVNMTLFMFWIVLNTEMIEGVVPFDPYPFGFLTMVVSLEAIILSVVVLISQNRSERIAATREELALQIDLMTEQEVTKLLHIVVELAQRQGIDLSQDKEIAHMLKPTNVSKIEGQIEDQL